MPPVQPFGDLSVHIVQLGQCTQPKSVWVIVLRRAYANGELCTVYTQHPSCVFRFATLGIL